MVTLAAVDIGANSVRLMIARVVRKRLQVLHEDREVVRLGEAVFRNGSLDPAGDGADRARSAALSQGCPDLQLHKGARGCHQRSA